MAKKAKKEIWSQEDEKYFFERYQYAQNNKHQYLLNQAFNLFSQKDFSLYGAIIRLLERYFSDFPNDKTERAAALHLRGMIYYDNKEFDKAFEYYKKAAEFEIEYPDIICGAWLSYAKFIVKFEKTELFSESEKFINIQYDKILFSEVLYEANAILAYIAEKKGDLERQEYYRKRADEMLKDLTSTPKSVRYINIIKIKQENYEIENKIREFLQNKRFKIGQRNGALVWFKAGFMCLHYITVLCLFDVVIIIAFISFRDNMIGPEREMGLSGFLVGFGKWPLKGIVRNLEKMIVKTN